MKDRVGQQLGNYRLTRLLGQGGFADVYLAEHVHLGTQAAVKVLSIRLTEDHVKQFREEARLVARLVHPHIVRILDFGVDENTPYLAIDYSPNVTLRQRHPKGVCLPLATIVPYVKQVAEALQYAHERNLIHRDIKPENMLLSESQQVLLSDFGIALVTQSTQYPSTQEVIGTAAYMAPEQFQGKPRRASDQYALGVVVYEWLCGQRPFHGTFSEIYSQHLFVPPPSLQQKVPELPSAIEEVVFKALAKDPQGRFASVQAFADALEQACLPLQNTPFVLPDQPLQPPHPIVSSSQHKWPTLQSNRMSTPLQPSQRGIPRRFVMLSLATLVVVGGGGLAWFTYAHAQLNAPSTPSSSISPVLPSSPLPSQSSSPTPTPTPSPTPTTQSLSEVLTIPFSEGTNGVQTTRSYAGIVTVTVSGTGQASGTQMSDAFYLYTDYSGQPITPVHPTEYYNWTLWINGSPADNFVHPIPPYHPSHVYTFTMNAPGGTLNFAVGDTATADNSGAYTVIITQS